MEFMTDKLWRVKVGLAEMLKGGVIMDVTNAQQAMIAEQAGGMAINGEEPILDLVPQAIHQRTPLVIGGRVEVEAFLRFVGDRPPAVRSAGSQHAEQIAS